MKKVLLIASFIGTGLLANAQFGEQGQKVLTGSLSFSSSKQENPLATENTNNGINLNLSYGSFVKKNVLSSFGISVINNVQKQKFSGSSIENKNTNQGYGVFYSRTYYKEIAKKLFFGLTGSINANYNTSKNTSSNSTNYSKSEGFGANIGLSPVFSYQLSNRLVGNLGTNNSFLNIGYSNSTSKNYVNGQVTNTSKSSNFSTGLGFSGSLLSNFSFGFSYLLKK